MKYFDDVRVINDCKEYNDLGVYKGMVGKIISAEIRDACFLVCFIDERWYDKEFTSHEENFDLMKEDIVEVIRIKDLELAKDNHFTDEQILDSLPSHDKRWGCKVEDGYILNFYGERQNKIAYDYDS